MVSFFLISCQKSTLLNEEKLSVGSLPFFKQWQLSIHLKICAACRRYVQQSEVIDLILQEKLNKNTDSVSNSADDDLTLTPDMRAKLLERLRSEN
ncbi:MAG: hypothetical protein IT269_12645 [Saprospiraceae bacterium]|nr:hypothetical protein [Saprospiraceae bacterium]